MAISFDFWYLPLTVSNNWCNTTRRWKKVCVIKLQLYKSPWESVCYLSETCRQYLNGLVRHNAHVWVLTVARCMQVNLQNSNSLFSTREYSLLLLRYMLQPIRIRFTALSCFETNIYQHVFLRGRTHANKAVTDRQTKFVNKHFITVLSVRLI